MPARDGIPSVWRYSCPRARSLLPGVHGARPGRGTALWLQREWRYPAQCGDVSRGDDFRNRSPRRRWPGGGCARFCEALWRRGIGNRRHFGVSGAHGRAGPLHDSGLPGENYAVIAQHLRRSTRRHFVRCFTAGCSELGAALEGVDFTIERGAIQEGVLLDEASGGLFPMLAWSP